MSHDFTLLDPNKAPKAVFKVPVEIWQEIIDHILHDPIAFITDPYYPGCNLHTAFDEWTDRRRLRKLEVQRGTLRLVSSSWRDLIDLRPWKYFEPYYCGSTTQQSTSAELAHRLDFDHHCVAGDHVAGRYPTVCIDCRYFRNRLPTDEDLKLGVHPFGATIVRMPMQIQGILYLKTQYSPLEAYFPNVRALFVSYHNGPTIQLWNLFTRLTFLSICLETNDHLVKNEVTRLSALKTLHVELIGDEELDFLEHWEMPLLTHFQVSNLSSNPNLPSLFTFLAYIGKGLVRLCLRIQEDYVILPDDFWTMVPVLNYFSTSVLNMESSYPIPPLSHSLRTYALLEEEYCTDDARDIACHLAGLWETLDTIGDCHNWSDAPKHFSGVVNSPDRYPGFIHDHRGTHCWQCIKDLYLTCREYGLRYEDREGRTLSSLQL